MNDQQTNDQPAVSPRRRLQELLAIPERLRTGEQWDEINELEITLAPVNRDDGGDRSQPRRNPPSPSERQKPSDRQKPVDRAKTGGDAQGKKPARKFHKKPAKPKAP